MSPITIVIIALVAVAAVAWWLLRRRASGARRAAARPRSASSRTQAPARVTLPPVAPAPAPARAASIPGDLPPELAAFRWLDADDLPAERRKAYVSMFRDIPRPPKLLQHLLSREFVNAASSAQLADLISAEPLIAAKVLAAVNSPLHGLARPVTSVGQAVTLLGVDSVRSVCLQYILLSSFKADSAERRQMLEAVWSASALASELTQRLAAQLELEDRGSMVSAVVLSFLGRLATTATTPAAILAAIPAGDLLARTAAEQAKLGLGASEIGRLLMLEWGLPSRVADDAVGVDRMLVTPHGTGDAQRNERLALCYLGARLGERLAQGDLADLETFDLGTQAGPELHHLRLHAEASPLLARLPWLLRAPEVAAPLRRMQAALRR